MIFYYIIFNFIEPYNVPFSTGNAQHFFLFIDKFTHNLLYRLANFFLVFRRLFCFYLLLDGFILDVHPYIKHDL